MKNILLILSFWFFTPAFVQTPGNLSFNFSEVNKSASATYNSYGKHVLAVWIQSDSGTFVKTISRNVGNVTRDHLQTWADNSGGSASNAIAANCNVVSATTGATLASFGPRSVNWDGKDANGINVPDGTYKISIEETWNHGSSNTVVRSFSFVKGQNMESQTPVADANFKDINLIWTPEAVLKTD